MIINVKKLKKKDKTRQYEVEIPLDFIYKNRKLLTVLDVDTIVTDNNSQDI